MIQAAALWSMIVLTAAAAPAAPEAVPEATSESQKAWFGLPISFYLPETAVAFGALGGVHLVRPDRKTSSIQAAAFVTAKRQASVDLMLQLFDSDHTAITGMAHAAYFPYDYYGLGPDAPRSAKESVTTRYAELSVAREWNLSASLRLGPKVHVKAEELVEVKAPDGISPAVSSSALKSADYRTAGLGATLTFDDRDSTFWPTQGTFVETWALAYSSGAGRNFVRGYLEARRFVALGRGHTVGLDAKLEAAGGDVPFTLLPKLGGALGLRGYYEGRWRDRFLWSTQAEWRFPIVWRLAGTTYAGVAGVAPSPARLDESRPRPAAGIGLRVRLTPTGLNLRADFAAGQDGSYTYITLGEAF